MAPLIRAYHACGRQKRSACIKFIHQLNLISQFQTSCPVGLEPTHYLFLLLYPSGCGDNSSINFIRHIWYIFHETLILSCVLCNKTSYLTCIKIFPLLCNVTFQLNYNTSAITSRLNNVPVLLNRRGHKLSFVQLVFCDQYTNW